MNRNQIILFYTFLLYQSLLVFNTVYSNVIHLSLLYPTDSILERFCCVVLFHVLRSLWGVQHLCNIKIWLASHSIDVAVLTSTNPILICYYFILAYLTRYLYEYIHICDQASDTIKVSFGIELIDCSCVDVGTSWNVKFCS